MTVELTGGPIVLLIHTFYINKYLYKIILKMIDEL